MDLYFFNTFLRKLCYHIYVKISQFFTFNFSQFSYSAVKTDFRQECHEGKMHKPCPRNVNSIT